MPKAGRPKKDVQSIVKRTRNWTFLVYPDSAPKDWREIIENEHIAWIEGPLHEGESKATLDNWDEIKPHIHVMLMYEGNKTFDQVKIITDKVNAPIPQMVASASGLVRYMIHLDHPDKKQYSESDIKAYGGADVVAMLRPSSSSRYKLVGEMMSFINDQAVSELSDLMDYARDNRFNDWFPLLCDNSAYVIGEYIKSCRYKWTEALKVLEDEEKAKKYQEANERRNAKIRASRAEVEKN